MTIQAGIKFFNFTQDSASSTWTINHSFNYNPNVDAWTTVSGMKQKIIPYDVTHPSTGTTVLTFSAPYSGSARLV